LAASLQKSLEEMATSEPLSFVVKREIVQRLAAFEGLSEVAKAIKTDYDIDLKPQRIQYYDPTKKAGAALAEDLKALFFETRKATLEDLAGIRISHKAHQLRALDRALTLAEGRGQIAMVIPLVEAAAKIAGTIVSKHEHTGKDGKDLQTPGRVAIYLPHNGRNDADVDLSNADLSSYTTEELVRLYRAAAAHPDGLVIKRSPASDPTAAPASAETTETSAT
jgi:hypothetical protein